VLRILRIFVLLAFTAGLTGIGWAGGGPQNVLIVVNANSSESLEIGNAYRRARGIPYRQVLTLPLPISSSIPYPTYLDTLEKPIRAYLETTQLEDEITCLVLTRGVPMQVDIGNGRATASLLAAMGLHDNLGGRITNPYVGSSMAFTHRGAGLQRMYLVTVLNGYDVADIQRLITQGATADGKATLDARFVLHSAPTAPAEMYAETQRVLALRGYNATVVNAPPLEPAPMMAYFSGGVFSGLTPESIAKLSFAPGAVVDTAQSFTATANNFDPTQTPVPVPVSSFVRAGASGVHGVIGDAGNDAIPMLSNQKLLLDRYTMGFSLAESYYAALPYLNWMNIIIGDPLCAPYAHRPVVTLVTDAASARGLTPLHIAAQNPAGAISRLDLYLDDHFLATVYEPGNSRLLLRLGDHPVSYTLPLGATLPVLLDGLAAAVNADTELSGQDGVQAIAQIATGTLRLVARNGGEEGNQIPVTLNIDNERTASAQVSARLDASHLTGGGQGPIPARATISLVGRRTKAGDQITVQIQQEKLVYTVPEDGATLPQLLDALVALVNASPTLQKPSGVRASRDPDDMPYLTLEARTPGEDGNLIPFHVTVNPAAGSQLKGYPQTPSTLNGGQDGSAASLNIALSLGDKSAQALYLLNTAALADGYHRLRAIAYDGAATQIQGVADTALIVANGHPAPRIKLPAQLPVATGTVTIPVVADDTVTRVDVYIDGLLRGSTTGAPYEVRVPLDGVARGVHDVWAESVDANGNSFITAPQPMTVLVSPEVLRIVPDHTEFIGGTPHRIYGYGFQPKSTVRLAGVPVAVVTYVSPSILDIVAAPGPLRRGPVEVTNADGTVGAVANGFDYYTPALARVVITPDEDIINPGKQAQFTAQCFDQYANPLPTTVTWSATGGAITAAGRYTAPTQPGVYAVIAGHPETPATWQAQVHVGPTPLPTGVVRQWLVLGPFPDPDYTGLESATIPEPQTQPSHGAQPGPDGWQSVSANSPYLDFAHTFTPNTDVLAYAHVYLHVPRGTNCALVFGSDDGIRIWLNGELLYSLRVRRAANPNQTTLPITLKAGWNRLLVKVDQGVGGWGCYLRLETRDGKPLPDVLTSLDKPE